MNRDEAQLRGLLVKVKELEGTYRYDADSKRYHRYLVKGPGLIGTIYFEKGSDIPERVILEREEHSI